MSNWTRIYDAGPTFSLFKGKRSHHVDSHTRPRPSSHQAQGCEGLAPSAMSAGMWAVQG